MLSPDEFGVVAVLSAIFAVAGVFQELGLSAATVQRRELSEAAVSSLFWINTAIGVVLTLSFVALAPAIASYFGRAELQVLCPILAMTFLLNGLTVQHRALLQRDMRFGTQARIDLTAAAAGGGAALLLAWNGTGYWALVAQMLVGDSLALLLLLRAVPLVPGRPVWSDEVADMLRYGASLFGFNVVYSISQNLSTALLGRAAGAPAAGIYTRAYVLANLPQTLLYGAAAHVALPKMSRIREAEQEFAAFYFQSARLVALVTVPVAVVFAVFAREIALCVYGRQWGEVADLLRAFACGLAVTPLMHTTGQIYLARGDSHRMFRWGVFGSAVICLGTVVGLRWGAVGAAWGWSAASLLLLFPCLYYAVRGSSISVPSLLKSVSGVYAAALGMLFTGWTVRALLEGAPLGLQLPLSLLAAFLAYAGLAFFVCGQKTLIESVLARILPDRAVAPGS